MRDQALVLSGGQDSTNIAVWIWKNLEPGFPALARVEVRRESCRHGCVYEGI